MFDSLAGERYDVPISELFDVAASTPGYRVRYTPATKLVYELVEAADDKQLAETIARYGRVGVGRQVAMVATGSTP
jgi:hypothetical protein